MKVWITKETGEIDFEYDVPVGIDDEYLLPSVPHALTPPPAVTLNQVAVYENDKWVIKPDFRGVKYWIGEESFTVDVIGEIVPEGAALNPQPSKAELLNSITVKTKSGKTFDGNETARNDILSTLTTGELLGVTETNWKMADNSVQLVTKDELLEALALAIQEKGRIVGAI